MLLLFFQQTKVDSKNAIEVAKNLTKIFKKSSSKDLTVEDVNLAANLLENIVSITGKLNEVILSSMNNCRFC